jgi:hypothetical protein
MEVVPRSVGEASRRWDDEHLDLQSASDAIAGAPTGGFTASVSGSATRFTSTWSRFAAELGTGCEARADSLRTTIQDFLATDDATFGDLTALSDFVRERR